MVFGDCVMILIWLRVSGFFIHFPHAFEILVLNVQIARPSRSSHISVELADKEKLSELKHFISVYNIRCSGIALSHIRRLTRLVL